MRKIIFLILIVILIAVLVFVLINRSNPSSQPIATATPTSAPVIPSVDPAEIDALWQGGSSYSDPGGVFTFLYPNDYKQDLQNDGKMVRVFKQGPTQTGQTEMYDGVIVILEPFDIGSTKLGQWVDERIKQATSDGTSQVTKAKKAIKLGKYEGFSYTLRGLGEFATYVIQKDANSSHALSITAMVEDPQKVGFQKEVDTMLSTIELLK